MAIMTLRMMTLGMMTLGMMTLGMMTLGIMTLGIMIIGIMTLIIKFHRCIFVEVVGIQYQFKIDYRYSLLCQLLYLISIKALALSPIPAHFN
jgi:hypothetical protein